MNKKVYIVIKELEYSLLKEFSGTFISFFDVSGTIARMLWKSISLWNNPKKKCEITILGTGHLGQTVLNYGLQLNLFSLEQEITYNFIGKDNSHRIKHGEIQTFNGDRVNFYNSSDDRCRDIIIKSDLVILSEDTEPFDLQTTAALCKGVLYCYCPTEGSMAYYFDLPMLRKFGMNSEIYTDANIRRSNLISDAMNIHYNYKKEFGSEAISDIQSEWNKLNGFYKCSNISSADFIPVIKALSKNGADVDTLARLEHIRWCRFYHLNFWQYDPTRNDKLKLHNGLCPFEQLSEIEKGKDIIAIKKILNENSE